MFAAPWEGRAFGLVVSLYEAGAFEWGRFQAALIARIGAWERTHAEGAAWSYYEHWLGALEDLLAADGTIAGPEITRPGRAAGRPAGRSRSRPAGTRSRPLIGRHELPFRA